MRSFTLALATLLALATPPAHAQGVTDAAIEGVATSADSAGAPVPAQITITNGATGARLLLRADVAGRFAAEHLAPGGPYRVEAHAPGLSAVRDGIMLALGQRARVLLALRADTTRLAEVRVTAQNPLLAQSRTGASHTVSDSAIHKPW